MSFPKYPEYKDSGVEWLGEVPAHWDVIKLKHLVRESNAGEVIDKSYWGGDAELLYTCAREPLPCDYLQFPEKKRTSQTDLLLTRNGTPYVHEPVLNSIYTNVVQRVSLQEGVHRHFMSLALQNSADNLRGYGVSIESLNYEMWKELRLTKPNQDEQTAIATFLDRETAKIDALVAEQEKLIALLQEKRQAVISHAVTKGLNPSVPMKHSGVEWLGEVPEHWEVCALRRVIAAIEQGWSPECYARESEEQEWGVLKAGCLNGGVFRPSENKALPPELSPEETYEVRAGDVLMSRASGSPELVGSTALVKATRERLMLSDKIFRLKLKGVVNAAFFVAALNSRPLRIQIENALSGGNGMANNLPQSSLLTFAIAVPPREEQATITVFLEQEAAKLDTLMTEARTAITLLQERRTALISAAVTGQIDVRNWSVSESA